MLDLAVLATSLSLLVIPRDRCRELFEGEFVDGRRHLRHPVSLLGRPARQALPVSQCLRFLEDRGMFEEHPEGALVGVRLLLHRSRDVDAVLARDLDQPWSVLAGRHLPHCAEMAADLVNLRLRQLKDGVVDSLNARLGELVPLDFLKLASLREVVLQQSVWHVPQKRFGGEVHGHTDPLDGPRPAVPEQAFYIAAGAWGDRPGKSVVINMSLDFSMANRRRNRFHEAIA